MGLHQGSSLHRESLYIGEPSFGGRPHDISNNASDMIQHKS